MIVSRLASGGMIAAGVYLLDVFCLGVKNPFARLLTREEYHQLLSQTSLQEPLKKVEPAVAKKLIEDAVAYRYECATACEWRVYTMSRVAEAFQHR